MYRRECLESLKAVAILMCWVGEDSFLYYYKALSVRGEVGSRGIRDNDPPALDPIILK